MKNIIRNTLVVILGIFLGSVVNITLLLVGNAIIKPPHGLNPTDAESLKQNIHLLAPIHFVTPFLAHALGTMVGAFVVGKLVSTKNFVFAMGIGFFFLLGGISTVFTIPAPVWFSCLDLLFAYIPMAYLGWKFSGGKKIGKYKVSLKD